MKFGKKKLLTTVSAVALMLAVGACSSGNDDGLTAERDDALAALTAAKTAAAAAATAAEEAQAAALAAAATAAEAERMTALADAATAAAAAQDMALADAATAADAAKMMALADAATAADAAKMMALADAATAADAAKMMALADAATLAGVDKAEALRLADEAHMTALADAKAAADAAQVTALADAKTAADAAQVTALADAKTAADAAQVTALADAKTAADAAQVTALADAKTAADAAQVTALADAKTAADAAQVTALADAKTAADAAQVTALADAKTAADAKLMAANDGLVAALQDLDLEPASDTMSVEDQIAANTATLKDALALVEEELADAMETKGLADRIAREAMISAAIGDAGRGKLEAKAFPNEDITGVMAKRDAAGMVAVTVSDEDYTGDEITAGSDDWNGVTLTNDTNTLVIFTDIEAPSDKLFTAQYDQTARDDILETADFVKLARSDSFPSEPDLSFTYTGAEGGRSKSFTGYFDGVPGQFACQATATCTLMTDSEGELQVPAEAEDWRFTPDAQNTATVKDPDSAYAHFGWWLNKPEDNTEPHMVSVFAGGTAEHAAMIDTAIEGNAKYAGSAAGKYATKTFTAGVQTDAAVGHFTANTTLTARFGDTADDVGTIDGSVTGFELDDGSSPAWKVILEEADISGTTFDGFTEVDFGGGATASGDPANMGGAGTWQGSFYGAANDANDAAPSTVAGTFDAVVPNASVIGAFGATKQ